MVSVYEVRVGWAAMRRLVLPRVTFLKYIQDGSLRGVSCSNGHAPAKPCCTTYQLGHQAVQWVGNLGARVTLGR